MMDKFAFAKFPILFVAVAVMHFDRNISSDELGRSVSYCKCSYKFFSANLAKSVALTAGLKMNVIFNDSYNLT